MRIGMLGAAKIGSWAIVQPSKKVAGVELAAVAARDGERARKYARRHGIASSYGSYDALLADDTLDAVYVPLPNGLHAEWSIKALDVGKHVLCEKPLCSNAGEARAMIDASKRNDRVLLEAFHYRFHPLTAALLDAAGTVGNGLHIETTMRSIVPGRSNIRYSYELGGGALMDMGAYTTSLLLALAAASGLGTELPEITGVDVDRYHDTIDDATAVDLRWPSGATGRMRVSLRSPVPNLSARLVGDAGEVRVRNPFLPHLYNRLEVARGGERTRRRVKGERTYVHQLREFLRLVDAGAVERDDLADSLAVMTMIDRVYAAAGLPRRGAGGSAGGAG